MSMCPASGREMRCVGSLADWRTLGYRGATRELSPVPVHISVAQTSQCGIGMEMAHQSIGYGGTAVMPRLAR